MREKLTRSISFILAIALVIGSFNFSAVSVEAASKEVTFWVSWGTKQTYKGKSIKILTSSDAKNTKLKDRWNSNTTKTASKINFDGKKSGNCEEYILDLSETYMGYDVDRIEIEFDSSVTDFSDPGFGIRIHNQTSRNYSGNHKQSGWNFDSDGE